MMGLGKNMNNGMSLAALRCSLFVYNMKIKMKESDSETEKDRGRGSRESLKKFKKIWRNNSNATMMPPKQDWAANQKGTSHGGLLGPESIVVSQADKEFGQVLGRVASARVNLWPRWAKVTTLRVAPKSSPLEKRQP